MFAATEVFKKCDNLCARGFGKVASSYVICDKACTSFADCSSTETCTDYSCVAKTVRSSDPAVELGSLTSVPAP